MPQILIVDDDDLIVELLSTTLRRSGFDVLTASGRAEAIELASGHPELDVALIDLTLPDDGGERTLEAIRARAPDVRMILTSGDTPEQIHTGAVARGEATYLQKPYSIATLTACVSSALEG
jgi:CheY-like chemotaxis protein